MSRTSLCNRAKKCNLFIKTFLIFILFGLILWVWLFGHHGLGSGYILRRVGEFDLRYYYGKEEIVKELNDRFPVGSNIQLMEEAFINMNINEPSSIRAIDSNNFIHIFSYSFKHGAFSAPRWRIFVLVDGNKKVMNIELKNHELL